MNEEEVLLILRYNNPMIPLYLIGGGGDDPAAYPETFGCFLSAARRENLLRVAVILCGEDEERSETLDIYTKIFSAAGAVPDEIFPVYLSPGDQLPRALIEGIQPTAIFVGGGLTPLYQQILTADRSWMDYLIEARLPYGGLSAGSAIASRRAIVGGWRADHQGQLRQVLYKGFSEGLDQIEARSGLGLVPFAIDVHASQWGTLLRLLHAVDLGLVPEGWAIDEDTMLIVEGDSLRIMGQGHAYHVFHTGISVEVEIQRAGQTFTME